MLGLTRTLPKEFRSTKIEMLSAEQEGKDRRMFPRRKPVALEYVLQRCGREWDLPYTFHAPQGTRQIFRYDRV